MTALTDTVRPLSLNGAASFANDDLKRANKLLFLFGLSKVPMIGLCAPKITLLDEEAIEVTMKTRWYKRNHLGSMYFGALAIGAEVTAGFLPIFRAHESGAPVSLAFADFQAEFHRRAHGDVVFRCNAVEQLHQLVAQTQESGERVTESVKVSAWVADEAEPVGSFSLGVSIKAKKPAI